jgi:nucleoside-diphosphate-sugar epimerase
VKRALVTGASGFFGRHAVVALAARGYEVHAVARHALPEVEATWHKADLLVPGAGAALIEAIRPTHLLHLAWDVGSGFWSAPDNILWAARTLDLVAAFHRAGGKRFVGAGTCAEYDLRDGLEILAESAPCAPATLYGIAKESAHRLIARYAREGGLSHGWGVLFFSYGPYEKPERLVPSVVHALLAGHEAQTTSGTQIRDFMDSRDAGAAFAALLDSEVEGAVNIASGDAVAVKDVVARLGALTGRADLVRLGARPMAENDPPRIVADVRRLREEVGFKPRYTLDQGLADAVSWWRQQL